MTVKAVADYFTKKSELLQQSFVDKQTTSAGSKGWFNIGIGFLLLVGW